MFQASAQLAASLKELGLELPQAVLEAELLFLEKVLEKNKVMNLTSITEPSEAVTKHLVDSLASLALRTVKAQVAGTGTLLWGDLGAGAGLPGLPLTIAVPLSQMHLVESTAKKAHFLEVVSAELGILNRVKVHNQRLEAVGQGLPVPRGTGLRGILDAVFVRGLSHLASVIELGLPLLKQGGLLVAYKGPKAQQEVDESKHALAELKAELVENWAFDLPAGGGQRSLLVLEKRGETPKAYPRMNGLPQKEPLR